MASMKTNAIDAGEILNRVAALAIALPEVRVERTNGHPALVVAEEKLAWFLNNYHGDGMAWICVKIDPETKEVLVEMDPEEYLRPACISRFGWLSMRLDAGSIDWFEVELRLTDSYRAVVPKRPVRESIEVCKRFRCTAGRALPGRRRRCCAQTLPAGTWHHPVRT